MIKPVGAFYESRCGKYMLWNKDAMYVVKHIALPKRSATINLIESDVCHLFDLDPKKHIVRFLQFRFVEAFDEYLHLEHQFLISKN